MSLELTAHASATSSDAPESARDAGIARGNWLWFGLAVLLLGCFAQWAAGWAAADDWWMHGIWCAVGFAVVFPILWKTFRVGVSLVLAEHLVMLTVAFTMYFLFGALLLAIGPQDQIDHVLAYFPIDAHTALRADAVNAVGFSVAIVVSALSRGEWLAARASQCAAAASKVPAHAAVLVLLVLGTTAWLNTLSVDLGMRDGIVAGAWRTTSKLSLVAIFLGAAHAGRKEKLLRSLSVVTALLLAYSGLLLFNKTNVLLPLTALVAGLALRYSSRLALIAGFAALVAVFLLIGGLTSFGRQNLRAAEAEHIGSRQEVLEHGLDRDEDTYNPWGRLCYTPSQGAGLYFYDAGSGGDDFKLIPWLFVPRILAPNKPIITQAGGDFHTKIRGRAGSSTGQGIFATGYYNGGWTGLVVASALCGWVLAQTSAVARAILSRRALLLLPFALLGVHMAFRIDGHFVADYLGAFMFMLYPIVFGSLVLTFFVRHARR